MEARATFVNPNAPRSPAPCAALLASARCEQVPARDDPLLLRPQARPHARRPGSRSRSGQPGGMAGPSAGSQDPTRSEPGPCRPPATWLTESRHCRLSLNVCKSIRMEPRYSLIIIISWDQKCVFPQSPGKGEYESLRNSFVTVVGSSYALCTS
jgi:hypothetical protein